MKAKMLMFVITLILFACSCGSMNSSLKKENLSGELSIVELDSGVYQVIHSFPWPGNSLIVKLGQSDFVWIDTPYTPEAASSVLEWLYKKHGKSIKITEINTGFHIDNLGGNGELIKRGIPVYGSQLTCELLKTRSRSTMQTMLKWLSSPENKRYYDAYKSFRFYEPTKKFNLNEEQVLTLGGEKVEIYFPGPTHTYDNTVVYIPGKKILFGGCMVLSLEAKKAGFVNDGNLTEWPKSLVKVLKKYSNAELVVPGHGMAGDIKLLKHSISVLENRGK